MMTLMIGADLQAVPFMRNLQVRNGFELELKKSHPGLTANFPEDGKPSENFNLLHFIYMGLRIWHRNEPENGIFHLPIIFKISILNSFSSLD